MDYSSTANAASELISEIVSAASTLEDSGTRALVLCSEGKHFCAGANFAAGEAESDRMQSSKRLYGHALRLFEIRIPIIAAVQGAAVGGGLGLACAADFRVASPGTRFHANFSSLGFHPGFGLSATPPSIVGAQHAMDMLYASRRIDGRRAREIGLVDRFVADGSQRAEAVQWACELAELAPLAVQSIKATLRGHLTQRVRKALERELAEQGRLWQTNDSKIGIAASLERRRPEFTGT